MEIVQAPDPTLHEVSALVNGVSNYVRDVARELVHYLEQSTSEGIKSNGLSAVQIGRKLRIIAVRRDFDITVLINPHIIKFSPAGFWATEGCLSIHHGTWLYEVFRYNRVVVKALNLNGDIVTYAGVELFGRVLQHEIDHLAGVLISDKGRFIRIAGGKRNGR